MSITIHSDLMLKFIDSGVPQYGDKTPFMLSITPINFEAIEWWHEDETTCIAVVLPQANQVLLAIMAMHNYIVEKWDSAISDFKNNKSTGQLTENRPYYELDNVQGFGYRMALIVSEKVEKSLQYKLPDGLEIYTPLKPPPPRPYQHINFLLKPSGK